MLNEAPAQRNDADSLEDDVVVNGRPAQAEFLFKGGLLTDIILNIANDTKGDASNIIIFDQLERTLETRYGAPIKCQRLPLPNIHPFINYDCEWISDDLRIDILFMHMGGDPVLTISYHAEGAKTHNAH